MASPSLRLRNPELRPLLAAVRRAVPGDLYVVGGFLRDILARRHAVDLDLALDADVAAAARSLEQALGGHAFPLDDERGQLRVVLSEDMAVRYVDFAPLRGDVQSDLAGRDYTIDAMAAPLLGGGRLGPLTDPFDGLEDVRSRTIRLVREQALIDDPLRLLRGPRLAAELDFTLDPHTAASIARHAPAITSAAAERQRDELCRIIETPRAASGIRLLESLGLLDPLLPELTAARGVTQPKEHYWDVLDHSFETLATLDALLSDRAVADSRLRGLRTTFRRVLAGYLPDSYFESATGGTNRLVLTKLAGLLHDVGKPMTRRPDETGRIRFFGHAELGAQMAQTACKRLRFGNRETNFVSTLVEEHLRPTQLANPGSPPTNRAIYRFFRDLGPAALACLVLSLADAAAAVGPRLQARRWRGHVSYIAYVIARYAALGPDTRQQRLTTGSEIMAALDIGPGPEVGRLLAAIDEAAGSGELRTREEALEYARSLREEWEREAARVGAGTS